MIIRSGQHLSHTCERWSTYHRIPIDVRLTGPATRTLFPMALNFCVDVMIRLVKGHLLSLVHGKFVAFSEHTGPFCRRICLELGPLATYVSIEYIGGASSFNCHSLLHLNGFVYKLNGFSYSASSCTSVHLTDAVYCYVDVPEHSNRIQSCKNK